MGANWEVADLEEYVDRYPKANNELVQEVLKTAPKGKKRNKYGNHKFEAEGQVWDSMKEYRRFKELQILEKIGEISDLTTQRPFILQKKQPGIRAIKYVSDFVYFETKTRKTIIEDVKSVITRKIATYRIKKKMLLKQIEGTDYEFREY